MMAADMGCRHRAMIYPQRKDLIETVYASGKIVPENESAPDIILADEPTANLDSVNTSKVLEIFRGLSQQGNTIIIVTHDRDFAERADRIIVMSDGQLAAGEGGVGGFTTGM